MVKREILSQRASRMIALAAGKQLEAAQEHEEAVKALEREKQRLAAEIKKLTKGWDNRKREYRCWCLCCFEETQEGRAAEDRKA
ncbi:uncharacterized protein G2W53_029371 [Senna tora]|uniref:Uncharacterized protein n=1 Tax=Senna tora TaxID=362788 RepID=A0A834T7I5_9FABA|nr:uncharacterized protein G2W53_029371 [Senna tora]